MRVTLLIDSLNSGGAQRQICMLAVLLARRGVDVSMITYFERDFFRPMLEEAGVPIECIGWKNRLDRLRKVRHAIRAQKPDAVIAFLNMPGFLAELSCLPRKTFRLIVSERVQEDSEWFFATLPRHLFQILADAVVSNSHAQSDLLARRAPWLRGRLHTILNCVDLEAFKPASNLEPSNPDEVRLVLVGRYHPQKNHLVLLEALRIALDRKPDLKVVIDTYGNTTPIKGLKPAKKDYLEMIEDAVSHCSLSNHFRLHTHTNDIARIYQESTALCLPSLYEGCSNVVCEAMACGKPILASRVGDNAVLVEEGANGFLFDPSSPQELADLLLRFCDLSQEKRQEMGALSRKRAEAMLAPQTFVEQFLRLIEGP
jgi:glycosyltransferase involved in cell wall biosynthesis